MSVLASEKSPQQQMEAKVTLPSILTSNESTPDSGTRNLAGSQKMNGDNVILIPQPSDDEDDPLVSTKDLAKTAREIS